MTNNILKSFPKQEVEKAALQYFKGDELAADVWIKKYCLKDENNFYELTPDDMHRRIAKEIARIEAKYINPLSEDQIYETLKNFKRIVPQGSPMSGIGNNFQVVSLGNCFVVGNDADSYGGIIRIDEEQTQLMKRRGGVGHDLSMIRPNMTPVKNSAITSTGIVPFMERYSNSTKEVAQDGRRGALMLSVSIKHPDAESFIDAKLLQGKISGANISVRIDDEFMNSALNEKSYNQQYPIDGIAKYQKEIDASKLWKKIVHNAWKSAEPGILFWDKILNESIPSCYGKKWVEKSTNPCVSEDTLILTDDGYLPIKELVGKKVNVWNGEEFSETIPAITGYNQKMIKIKFSDGSELKCTPYHKFYTWKGFERDGKVIKKNGNELIVGDKLEKYKFPKLKRDLSTGHHIYISTDNIGNGYITNKEFYTAGFFAGDGHIKRNDEYMISLYGVKKELIPYLEIIGNESEDIANDKITVRINLPEYFKFSPQNIPIKKIIPIYEKGMPELDVLNWLAGLIDSDGSRNSDKGSISISSIDKNFLMQIKLNILNTFGINGSVIDEKNGGIKKIKGIEYETNKSYRLIISAHNVKKLYDLGLRTHRVKIDDVNPNRDASRFITVESIESIDDADVVYCFTEEKRGRGCFNGVVTGQCGELPLPPYDSCRLVCMNLYGYVVNPFTVNAYFDEEAFSRDVQIAMRYMDDIVDLEVEKIDTILLKIQSDPESDEIKLVEKNLWEKIRGMALEGRRTGLGVTAEGDMLAALGLRYGTEEATIFSENVHKGLKLNAYRSSVTMAKERGAFPIYNHNLESSNPFILRILEEDPQLHYDMWTYGRRNIALLTIAPTGSASLMTQTTSGIEPAFLPVYMRRRKINPQEKDVRVDFIDDEGISWMQYPVFHHKFEIWLEVEGYDVNVVKTMSKEQLDEIVKKSPYYKATSNDVDWVMKVIMQGKIQKHIDHSISVTVNLPESVSEETVAKVYETGWKSGCKGITVYRDGSRNGVLVGAEDNKKENFHENHTPKRPKRLKGEIHKFQNNLEKWIAVVGLRDGRPYEIFTGRLENGLSKLPPNIKDCEVVKQIFEVEEMDEDGKMIKVRKKRYDIEYIDSNGEKQIHTGLNHAFNPEYWNYAKLFSGVLRHGMPIIYVYQLINSMNLNSDHLNTWKNGVARTIKKYIKDGEKIEGKCPECGSEHLEFKEGCLICMSCGSSKCN